MASGFVTGLGTEPGKVQVGAGQWHFAWLQECCMALQAGHHDPSSGASQAHLRSSVQNFLTITYLSGQMSLMVGSLQFLGSTSMGVALPWQAVEAGLGSTLWAGLSQGLVSLDGLSKAGTLPLSLHQAHIGFTAHLPHIILFYLYSDTGEYSQNCFVCVCL